MYEKTGSNQEDLIVFDVIVRSSDTKESMVNAYQTKAGITPTFPIILYDDGGNEFAKLFGKAGQGKPTWILHPTREFEETSYIEPTMSNDIEIALSDSCIDNQTPIIKNLNIGSIIKSISIYGSNLNFLSTRDFTGELSIISLNGKKISTQKFKIFKGDNKISIKEKLPLGIYVINIKNSVKTVINYRLRNL